MTEVEDLKRQLAELRSEMRMQQQGALLYIAAIVERAVGVGVQMTLSEGDMIRAYDLELERADPPHGGLVLRVRRNGGLQDEPEAPKIAPPAPVLAKAERTIVLLDPSGRPNQ